MFVKVVVIIDVVKVPLGSVPQPPLPPVCAVGAWPRRDASRRAGLCQGRQTPLHSYRSDQYVFSKRFLTLWLYPSVNNSYQIWRISIANL